MSERLTVAVLFGGRSSEYEVSLRSASFVLSCLPEEKYNVLKIGITREGVWKLFDGDPGLIPEDRWDSPELPEISICPGRPGFPFLKIENGCSEPLAADVAFPVLHGKNGEDGTVQGALQLARIPVVGPGCDASAVCMNKDFTHCVLEAAGIATAPWICLHPEDMKTPEALEKKVAEKLGYPVFVKPARAGSSVGVSKAKDAAALIPALKLAFGEDSIVLVEGLLTGAEVECAVLGNSELFATEPAEILSAAEFYDYDAKYNNEASQVIIPARLSAELTDKVRETARRAYRALNCAGLSRVDMFARADGKIFVNEVNTLPGFTVISAYPKMMAHSGIQGRELCERLVKLAMEA